MIDLGNFGSGLTSAVDINDFGQIAGYSYVGSAGGPFVQHPFLYQSGTWRDLSLPAGLPLGIPSAINNLGQVVGNSNSSLGSVDRPPFLYSGGTIYNLNTLLDSSGAGVSLELAYDINDNGEILAEDAGYNAVLLTPVPEPSALALAVVGRSYRHMRARPPLTCDCSRVWHRDLGLPISCVTGRTRPRFNPAG